MSLGQEIKSHFDRLRAHRNHHDREWQDIVRYLSPATQGFYTKLSDASPIREDILDSEPERASDDLSSSMLSFLADPGSKWFTLRAKGQLTLEERRYLQEAEDLMRETLMLRSVNFYSTVGMAFDSLVNMGMTATYHYRDEEKKLPRFNAIPLSEVYIQRDQYGMVDVVYRRYVMSPRQIRQQFELSDAAMSEIIREESKNPEKEIEIVQAVYPREDRAIDSQVNTEKKYASVYVWYEKGIVLKESGFDYFPYTVPVWKLLAGETYGRGPGHRALPDIKTLNKMIKTNLAAAESMITPPLVVPWGLMLDDTIDASPRAINFIDLNPAMIGAKITKPEPLNLVKDLPVGVEMEDRRKAGIRLAFYSDLLQEFKNAEMSATETVATERSRVRKFTGPFTRIKQDFLGLTLEFVYETLVKFGDLKPPASLGNVKIEFSDVLDEAYKSMKVATFERAISSLAAFKGIPPEILTSIREEDVGPFVFANLGAPLGLLRTQEESQQRLEQARQNQTDMQQASALRDAGAGVRDLTQALGGQ